MDVERSVAEGVGRPSLQREDIQFLRGVAVLAVLFYHADLVGLRGGYLGVDVFFVISGYLISRNILRELAQRRFSFADFYLRRARRLLPAAYCTLTVTTLLASKVLTEDRWEAYVAQLIGALTFTANFVLPFQSGYFETASATKPLLHMWSLSVEEQFYLVTPLLLWLTVPRWRLATLSTLLGLSLLLCLVMVGNRYTYWRLPDLDSQQLAFFMLPTRAWQLLAGSVLACMAVAKTAASPPVAIKRLALLGLCGLLAMPVDTVHPRIDAVAAVALTSLMLSGSGQWIGNTLPSRLVARVGDWSYSLYLVHWPLFALANGAFLGQVPASVRMLLVVLSIVLAWLQFKHVEQRFRYPRQGVGRTWAWLGAASLATAALPLLLAPVRLERDASAYAYLRERNGGLSSRCAAGAAIENPVACSTSSAPRIVLWGDSFAMHLVPGLRQVPQVGGTMLQVTKAACAPIPGVASLDENHDAVWARGCLTFNARALDMIKRDASIKYVIMSSPFAGYLDQGELSLFHEGRSIKTDRRLALEGLISTINDLQDQGKRVIIVAPPPTAGFDIGACHEHLATGLLVLGRTDCDFSVTDYESRQRGMIDGIKEAQLRTGASVVWFEPLLCSNGVCKTRDEYGTSIYKDRGHLSVPGSIWAVPKLGLDRIVGG